MSDKNTTVSWSKPKNTSNKTSEDIIVPNEDVFDLHDFITPSIPIESTAKSTKSTPVNKIPDFEPKTSAENYRRNYEEKFFYQNKGVSKPRELSNWFIVTFLMVTIILGTLFFYFLLEDKNNQISGLERQLSNKADNRVKGVVEVKDSTAESTESTPQTKSNLTVTNSTVSSQNFTIFVDIKDQGMTVDKTTVSINYLDGQIGTKVLFTKNKDFVEIYSAEKQTTLDTATIQKNILKIKTDLIQDKDNLKSKNGVIFTSLKSQDPLDTTRLFVGTSDNFSYIITTKNDTKSDFITNILSNTSFN